MIKMANERTDLRTSIIIESIIVVALGAVAITGAHYFLTPVSSKPQSQSCQTIRVGDGEELGDVVRRMRVYDSGINLEKLAGQNNLLAQGKVLNVLPGTELKYCYGK